jgi:peptide-methionine (S)-S-oxide reductase
MKLKLKYSIAVTWFTAIFFSACSQPAAKTQNVTNMETNLNTSSGTIDTATFGAGCFWCVEAVFQRLEGVIKVESGYSGGTVKNPAYREVCNGTTGHAEVCQITYDKSKISFKDLLEVFWKTHDPTTLNRQGNDSGTQYRSAIFYHNAEQKELAEKYKAELNKSGAWNDPVITEIAPFTAFYKAEDYHQNYFNQNGGEPYCQYVIQPKVEKFEKVFKDKMKK